MDVALHLLDCVLLAQTIEQVAVLPVLLIVDKL